MEGGARLNDEQLLAEARDAMTRAYAPYSGYRVGAALLTGDGSVVTGCNVENVSYGLTMCAERVAVARAVAEGKGELRTIALVTDVSDTITPCGACRQVLAELAPNLRVVSQGRGAQRSWSLAELLPEPFLPEWVARKDDESL